MLSLKEGLKAALRLAKQETFGHYRTLCPSLSLGFEVF